VNPTTGSEVAMDAFCLPGGAPHHPLGRYLDRELSWLDFNERVLALAERRSLPLFERVKFLAIFSSNLDEFFQVRVGGLKMQLDARIASGEPDEGTIGMELSGIGSRVRELVAHAGDVFSRQLVPELSAASIRLPRRDELDDDDRAFLDRMFDGEIFPHLTPLAVDPAHPFPYISNLSLNLAAVVRAPGELTRRIAWVKVPPDVRRFVVLPDGGGLLPVEEVIAGRLSALFPGMEILDHFPFRVTRNTDYDVDLDADDMVAAVESVLRRRRRSETVVRLEVDASMSDEALGVLRRELRIGENDIYRVDGLLDLGRLWSIASSDRPELKLELWKPVTKNRIASVAQSGTPDLLSVLRDGDLLVHHPYDSFETSVEAFVESAAGDPAVVAIKLTLYRTSTAESRIMEALISAAQEDKQVVCIVELKARFDEEANIGWSQRLEDAGVHVVYGIVGLKTHAKLCLAVRADDDGLRRYAHIGTGNYNPDTAQLYEDVGLFTADPGLTADVSDVFNLLTGHSRAETFRTLLVAPGGMRSGLLELIRGQASAEGRIAIKLNGLADPEVIDALYEAAGAGARIDLYPRSICCLRPGVSGLSETIRVRSLVGRYLEHSRVFRFGSGQQAAYLIGSADLMQRNLDRRVEVLAPVSDQALRKRVDEMFDLLGADDTLAWELMPDGRWRPPSGARGINAQTRLEKLALTRARRIAAVTTPVVERLPLKGLASGSNR
jgi:polyphosphate kinase